MKRWRNGLLGGVGLPLVLLLAAGAMAQDGGAAVDNLSAQIPAKEWLPLAKEFFLS